MTLKNESKQMYEQCKKHMHSYVLAKTVDGMSYDGIITGLDPEYVYIAVPIDAGSAASENLHDRSGEQRYFGPPGYGTPYYGHSSYGPGYGHPPRRFRRVVLPLAALTALTLLAWY